MTIDGIILNAVTKELQEKLINGKIQKINQINKNVIIITIYNNKNYKLLLSSDSQAPRVHLTNKEYTNPLTPSNYTMVLRKHLQNARIKEIKQNGLDRTLEIVCDSRNELGFDVDRKIIIDLMGKHSNIVLVDENNKVIEAIKRVSHDMSRVRAVYPGTIFNNIESGKINIFEEKSGLQHIEVEENMKIFKIFYTFFDGFSPAIGREISYLADLDPKRNYGSLDNIEKERLESAFQCIVDKIVNSSYQPNMIYIDGKISDFYAFRLQHLGKDYREYPSISEVIDDYYLLNTNDDSLNQSKSNLEDMVKKIISKKAHKLDLMNADFENSKNYDDYRIQGELLQANAHAIHRGLTSINLLNYYTNDNMEIKLDNRKDAWQNIELKYKQSKKLKRANEMLKLSIPEIKSEIEYLHGILLQIESVENHQELQEIREELYNQDYIKTANKKNKKKDRPSLPLSYITNSGSTILVGKNNKQNEKITLRESSKEDLFFHIKDLPGSHVILKNDSNVFNQADIESAAYLAAKNSKYSEEKYIDVDYTKIKYVFKQKGSKPGMVHYTNFNTIRVNLEVENKGFRKK